MTQLEKISWIGCGKVGRTLAKALKDAGYQIGLLVCRRPANTAEALAFVGAGEAGENAAAAVHSGAVHFITTNDDGIADVVEEIYAKGPASLQGHYFLHTSGSINSTVLEPLQKKGAETGSIHPLQVFADPAKALETLPGIYYAIEGTDKAMSLAVQLVHRLQGKLLLIPTGRKVLYHVAGVFAANYLTVLVNYVLRLMDDIGETPEEAYQAFLPLIVGALQNIEEFGVAAALTGPIVRGDVETIRKHLLALDEVGPEMMRAYKLLGQEAVHIALRGGRLSQEKGREMVELLKG